MPFDDLGLAPLLRHSLDALRFSEPTPIQRQFVPPALTGRDVIGLAATGTGKTLAYLLPVAHRLLAEPPPLIRVARKRGTSSGKRVEPRTRLRALVLVPTRELAQQVAKDAAALVRGSVLKATAVWGKSPLAPQREAIVRGVDIVVGTPGRVRELLDLDALSLAYIRHVVVDEADRMLDLGFLPQVEGILERMPPERQILFLSATFPRVLDELTARFLREPQRVEASGHTRPSRGLEQTVHEVEDPYKTANLLALVAGGKRRGVLVFVRTRRRAGWVAEALRANEITTGLLHGDRSQAQREKALEEFAAGRLAALVATDVAARGLHIPAIRTVVNYDVPLLPEEYVHRVGRAGHGGGFAESFTFVTPDDEERARWRRIVAMAKLELPLSPLPDFDAWLRPLDRERLERSRRKAAASVKPPPEGERVPTPSKAKDGARRGGGKRGVADPEVRPEPKPRKKTTKRAGKSKRPLRGGHATRTVSKSERPGSGVRVPKPPR